ncbi:protein of unknown function [Nitrospira japonica]|uniref:Uncharacterized protein n=1 Tax=Nitrospira japonica TaxID=1325564 RepID=A0A1W1I506_9BACT|nr:protein of unknown function [Nitrospira japonica]
MTSVSTQYFSPRTQRTIATEGTNREGHEEALPDELSNAKLSMFD